MELPNERNGVRELRNALYPHLGRVNRIDRVSPDVDGQKVFLGCWIETKLLSLKFLPFFGGPIARTLNVGQSAPVWKNEKSVLRLLGLGISPETLPKGGNDTASVGSREKSGRRLRFAKMENS